MKIDIFFILLQLILKTFPDSKLVYSFASFESPITYLIQSPVVDVIAVGLLNGMIKLYNIRADELIISFKQEERVTAISFRTGELRILFCI